MCHILNNMLTRKIVGKVAWSNFSVLRRQQDPNKRIQIKPTWQIFSFNITANVRSVVFPLNLKHQAFAVIRNTIIIIYF